jgi:hypothetical protein
LIDGLRLRAEEPATRQRRRGRERDPTQRQRPTDDALRNDTPRHTVFSPQPARVRTPGLTAQRGTTYRPRCVDGPTGARSAPTAGVVERPVPARDRRRSRRASADMMRRGR